MQSPIFVDADESETPVSLKKQTWEAVKRNSTCSPRLSPVNYHRRRQFTGDNIRGSFFHDRKRLLKDTHLIFFKIYSEFFPMFLI